MPLVVPQVSKDEKAAWVDRLLGKRITDDTTDQMVGISSELLHLSRLRINADLETVLCQEGPPTEPPHHPARPNDHHGFQPK